MSIRYETITVGVTVMYCDGCGQRGPETAYGNIDDTIDCAEQMGWRSDDGKNLCSDCLKKAKKRR